MNEARRSTLRRRTKEHLIEQILVDDDIIAVQAQTIETQRKELELLNTVVTRIENIKGHLVVDTRG